MLTFIGWLCLGIGAVFYVLDYQFNLFNKKKKSKKEDKQLLDRMSCKDFELSKAYRAMLIVKKKIKVLIANTDSEFEQLYNDFMASLKGDGRLEGIWSIEKPKIIYENEKLIGTIEYSVFSLKDGVTTKSYIKAVNEFDEFHLQYISFENKFRNKNNDVN